MVRIEHGGNGAILFGLGLVALVAAIGILLISVPFGWPGGASGAGQAALVGAGALLVATLVFRTLMSGPETWPLQHFLSLAGIVGPAGLALYATQFGWPGALRIVGIGAVVGLSSMLVGALIGFLFGLPHSPSLPPQSGSSAPLGSAVPALTSGLSPSTGGTVGARPTYFANTNLEQISDWLTKILVGVGLVQISQLVGQMQRLAAFLAPAFGGQTTGATIATAVVLYALLIGFLGGFLQARLRLAGAFAASDLAAPVMEQIEAQRQLDASALAAVNRKLSPDAPTVSQTDLELALGQASAPTKVEAFARAYGSRSDQPEAAAAIFRALTRSDPDRFHRTYGELGFLLMQEPGRLSEAKSMLDKAIQIRDEQEPDAGLRIYELRRAICNIRLQVPQATAEPNKVTIDRSSGWNGQVQTDLQTAWSDSNLHEEIQNGPTSADIARWILATPPVDWKTILPGWLPPSQPPDRPEQPSSTNASLTVDTLSSQLIEREVQSTDGKTPIVDRLVPDRGSWGMDVVVQGSGLTGVTGVHFGSSLASSVRVVSDSEVKATVPPGTGKVDVTVVGPGGRSGTSAATQFEYTFS